MRDIIPIMAIRQWNLANLTTSSMAQAVTQPMIYIPLCYTMQKFLFAFDVYSIAIALVFNYIF